MATTTPLIGAPIPESGDDVADLLEVDDLALHVEKYTVQRYATVAARDTARPVPDRGETVVIGTTAANSFMTWYDGAAWRGVQSEQLLQDATYPQAASSVTVETVLSRITVPARDYARHVSAEGSTSISYTQANTMGLLIYAGAAVIARTQRNVAASVADSFHAVSTTQALAAGATLVLELRAARIAGTGSFSTSTSGVLTSFKATVTPA